MAPPHTIEATTTARPWWWKREVQPLVRVAIIVPTLSAV